ncbi:MAG TPA: aminotransferase class V-fold PLP-dependent enzyme, partial [Firmicutes bacterium]|nr:aminotransferase class V-fold PLP-dependent enzyme [Bacillota bacterium]
LNCTDALNMALKGVLKPGDHVVTSALEHNSILRPLEGLRERGVITYTVVPASPVGELDPADFARAVRPDTRLIAVTHASNVIGSVTPLAEVGAVARQAGTLFLVDAAQTAGVLPIDVQALGIDLLAFAGHKGLLGPMGTGGLYVRPSLELASWREGGTGSRSELTTQPDFYPDHLEAGTPNTPGIAGLNAGLDFILKTGLEAIQEKEQALSARLHGGLAAIPGVKLYGSPDLTRRVAVLSFTLDGRDNAEIAVHLDRQYGIMSRPGLQCAPLAHQALGTFPEGTVRLSLGYFNTEEEVDQAIRAIAALAK